MDEEKNESKVVNTFIILLDILIIGFFIGVCTFLYNEGYLGNPIEMVKILESEKEVREEVCTIVDLYKEDNLYYVDIELPDKKQVHSLEISMHDFLIYKVGDTIDVIIKGNRVYIKE